MLKNTSHLGSCRSITTSLSLVTATIIAHLEESPLKKPRPGHTQEHTVQGTTLILQKGKQPWRLEHTWPNEEQQLCKYLFSSISTTPLPYHTAFLCTATQGMFLVTTDCPNLRQDYLYRRHHPQFVYIATLRAYHTTQRLGKPFSHAHLKKKSLRLLLNFLWNMVNWGHIFPEDTLYWLFVKLETRKGSHRYSMHACFFKEKSKEEKNQGPQMD